MALPTAQKLCIKYGLHLLVFFILSSGIIWKYQYPKNNCIHTSVPLNRQHDFNVQANIHHQQNENTEQNIENGNKTSPKNLCSGVVDFRGSICPPGYQRRLTDVVFMMDQNTGTTIFLSIIVL